MPLLSRKKRQPGPRTNKDGTQGGSGQQRELQHSLSLPDLTTPLLDPSSWESIPDFPGSIPSLPNAKSANGSSRSLWPPTGIAAAGAAGDHVYAQAATGPRGRSPSLVSGGPGSPVAFHKPFSRWQVVNEEAGPVPPLQYRGDFRKSAWSRDSGQGAGSVYPRSYQTAGLGMGAGHQARRRKKGRVAERLNVMVVGGKGVGKTSFLTLLRDASDNLEGGTEKLLLSPTKPSKHIQTPSSPTSPGPPITPSDSPLSPPAESPVPSAPSSPIQTTKAHPQPHPPLQWPAPTTRLSSSSTTLDRPAEKLQLELIDTPGLDLRGDDGPAMHARRRERGVTALLRVAEDRFGEVLREEAKVVRRQLSGGSGLLHLCIYLIDARAVLYPVEVEVDVDWSGLCISEVSPEHIAEFEKNMEDLCPGVAKVEIDIIRRLGKRMNVLPILTHTDHLSIAELSAVREAVRRDLAEGPSEDEGRGFGMFGMRVEEDQSGRTPLPPLGTSTGGDELPSDDQPPTPTSIIYPPGDAGSMPYAIFAPSDQSRDRAYPWGTAEVAHHSDLDALREAILDTHAKALRSTTREVLYERYRTEQLLARRAKRGLSDESAEL